MKKRNAFLTDTGTGISAHFSSPPPHTAPLSPQFWHPLSISNVYFHTNFRHIPRACWRHFSRPTNPSPEQSPQPPSLFPSPSNLSHPFTSTPRITNVTAVWDQFQSYPHFLEELFRVELIYFHSSPTPSLLLDIPMDFLFHGFMVHIQTRILLYCNNTGWKIPWLKFQQLLMVAFGERAF